MPAESLLHRILRVEYVGGHTIRLRFDDGTEGDVDLGKVIVRFPGLLAALRDPAYVAQVMLDREAGTVAWPNGVDLDPLVLYCALRGVPVPDFAPRRRGRRRRRSPRRPLR
jgi:hypothetical protein